MTQPSEKIALRATAIVVQDDKVVLVSRDGSAWDTPGGRAEPREALPATLLRECLEEAGMKVEVGPVCHVQESFFYQQGWRLVEIFFLCRPLEEIKTGECKDADGSSSRIGIFSFDELSTLPVVRPAQLLQKGWLENLPHALAWGGSIIRPDLWKGVPTNDDRSA